MAVGRECEIPSWILPRRTEFDYIASFPIIFLQVAICTRSRFCLGLDIPLQFNLLFYRHSLRIVKTSSYHRQVATPSQHNISLCQDTNNYIGGYVMPTLLLYNLCSYTNCSHRVPRSE